MLLSRNPEKLGIYIHFPFCIQKCYYCDFYSLEVNNFISIEEIIENFLQRLKEEIKERYSLFKNFKVINTIFFGGGTSSFLPALKLKEIIDYLKNFFEIENDCEITLEGNPEHLYNEEYVLSLKEIGINRINCGFQTFNFKFHKVMNRYFHIEHYSYLLNNLAKNFNNFGVDLIYGYPGQTREDFFNDLEYVIQYPVKHLSLYALTVEKGTPYEKFIKLNKMSQPEFELQEYIFEILPKLLINYGFEQYEVSNFSKRGYASRHNLRYWLYEPYMGLGPSAHGFNGVYRYNNVKNWVKWLKKYNQNYILHEPLKEIPITMFRIVYPIKLSWFNEITDNYNLFINFFYEISKKGYGSIQNYDKEEYFQWNHIGISFLDSIIVNFYDYVEKNVSKL